MNTTQQTANDVLGINQPVGTIQAIKIISSGSTYYGFVHIIAMVCMLLTTASLIVPPRWINGGKGALANFQRSGILTLILGIVGLITTFASFGVYLTFALGVKSAVSKINGLSFGFGPSNSLWVGALHYQCHPKLTMRTHSSCSRQVSS